MARTEPDFVPDCSEDAEVMRQIFQAKWRLRILQELVDGPARLSELRRKIPESSKKMLVDTLHGLESMAWIERRDVSTRVKKIEYRLSQQCAEKLRRVVDTLQPR